MMLSYWFPFICLINITFHEAQQCVKELLLFMLIFRKAILLKRHLQICGKCPKAQDTQLHSLVGIMAVSEYMDHLALTGLCLNHTYCETVAFVLDLCTYICNSRLIFDLRLFVSFFWDCGSCLRI